VPRRKDISNDIKEATDAASQSEMGYKVISKLFGFHYSTARKISHKWKTFKTASSVLNHPRSGKFTPRTDSAQKSCKKPELHL